MGIIDEIKKLCTPAYVYLLLSVIANVAFIVKFNTDYTDFCRGKKACIMESVVAILFVEFFLSFIWMMLLQWVCNKGFSSVSWVLVLLPYMSFLLYISYIVWTGEKKSKEEYHKEDNIDLDDIEPY